MNFVAAKCPECAGSLQVPDDRDVVKCTYCGVDVVVRQAIQLVSGSAKGFADLAKAAAAAGNHTEAYDYFTRMLELEASNGEAWYGKGRAAGWLSSLTEFRFGEVRVAYENAIQRCAPGSVEETKAACAGSMRNLGTACFNAARKHMIEHVTSPEDRSEYLSRCRQIISLYQAALDYSPGNTDIMKRIVDVCADNIEGVKYVDPYDGNSTKWTFLAESYEDEMRGILDRYALKISKVEPDYVPPNPRGHRGRCFVVTATMGDETHPAVSLLRRFREEVLLKSEAGIAFASWYETHGPRMAMRIEGSKPARIVTFAFVVMPAVVVASLALLGSRSSRRR